MYPCPGDGSARTKPLPNKIDCVIPLADIWTMVPLTGGPIARRD